MKTSDKLLEHIHYGLLKQYHEPQQRRAVSPFLRIERAAGRFHTHLAGQQQHKGEYH
jgi:hypothetical protein